MPQRAYVKIAEKLLLYNKDQCEEDNRRRGERRRFTFGEYIFPWIYLILSWVLMGRTNNIDLKLGHISWRGDSLRVVFASTKADQLGADAERTAKHCYAVPDNPAICPVFALAVWLFTMVGSPERQGGALFPGLNVMNRFGEALRRVLDKFDDLKCYVDEVLGIGSHSNRKGVLTHVLQFSFVSPVAAYLRAGWSLGGVKDRYVMCTAGGDQAVGRAASGLPTTDSRMAALPPHFSSSDFDVLAAIGWGEVIPHYDKCPACFRGALPYLVASVIYQSQRGWLQENLPESHPIFDSFIFQRRLEGLDDMTLAQRFSGRILSCNFRCESTGMEATGVPDHIKHAEDINRLRDDVYELSSLTSQGLADFKEDLHTSLDDLKRDTKKRLHEQVGEVVAGVLNNCEVNGAIPLTQHSVEALMTSQYCKMIAAIRELHSANDVVGRGRSSQPDGADVETGSWSTDAPLHRWSSCHLRNLLHIQRH